MDRQQNLWQWENVLCCAVKTTAKHQLGRWHERSFAPAGPLLPRQTENSKGKKREADISGLGSHWHTGRTGGAGGTVCVPPTDPPSWKITKQAGEREREGEEIGLRQW